MYTDPISSSTLGTSQEALTPRIPTQKLDQKDFLKLLVAQLTSQDPLNPQKDTEFIAQMAQFSSLEQSRTMESDISKMRQEQQLLQADSLLGRSVALQSGQDGLATGVVSAVQFEAGTPKLVVDGQTYDLSDVRMIVPPSQITTNP